MWMHRLATTEAQPHNVDQSVIGQRLQAAADTHRAHRPSQGLGAACWLISCSQSGDLGLNS